MELGHGDGKMEMAEDLALGFVLQCTYSMRVTSLVQVVGFGAAVCRQAWTIFLTLNSAEKEV